MNSSNITLSTEELSNQSLTPESLSKAVSLFNEHGYLILNNVFHPNYIQGLHKEHTDQINHYIERHTTHSNTNERPLALGHNRLMLPLKIKNAFLDSNLFKNKIIFSIAEQIIPKQIVLSSFGSTTSFPGATEQGQHFDGPRLFEEDIPLSNTLPCYALTVSIPLVTLDSQVGGTSVWPGTHKIERLEEAQSITPILDYPTLGGCTLWDYRTLHAGQANLSSDTIRPLIYFVYARSWFKDPNFTQHKPLNITKEDFLTLQQDERILFKLM